jgi:alpha-L-fucosidase
MTRLFRSLLTLALIVASLEAGPLVAAERAAETKAERDVRMQWWREARFGMFIHWGLYSVPAGTYKGKQIGGIGEWIMNDAEIPVAEYATYAKQFNPVKFDADKWVSIAKNAGMKYMVITSKHHDGFAMFHSRASAYNIYDATPFHRDPLQELSVACRKQGIKLGFYYSQAQDWHHPGGFAYQTHGRKEGHWDKAQDGDMHQYIEKIAIPQVRELMTNYGDVAVLWWDTPAGMSRDEVHDLAALLKLQPKIIANNRLGNGIDGDTETPEQYIPAAGYPGRDWETCMTMNGTWGYKSYDNSWKPAQELIHNLIDIASKGGNYLLNVGPTSLGEIPAASVERLAQVGAWLKVNGEAIYGTSASPFKPGMYWGRATQKPGKIYLHVFAWPAGGTLAVPLANEVHRAYLLASPADSLEVRHNSQGLTVRLPAAAPDKVATVVVLEIDGAAQPIVARLQPAADGSLALAAIAADIHGTAQLENLGGEPSIGFWTDVATTVSWNAAIKAGSYDVELEYACQNGSEGSTLDITAGDARLSTKIAAATGGWNSFRTVLLGKLAIVKDGHVTIAIKPSSKPGQGVMNLRGLKLKPAR